MVSVYFFTHDKIASGFTVKKFRKKGKNVFNYLGRASLHLASEEGHLSLVQLLLKRGSNIDQKDKYGEFILFLYWVNRSNMPDFRNKETHEIMT